MTSFRSQLDLGLVLACRKPKVEMNPKPGIGTVNPGYNELEKLKFYLVMNRFSL